jgi:hypothetical protein
VPGLEERQVEAVDESAQPPSRSGTSLRAPIIGLAGTAALCWATIRSDLILRGSWIAHNALPIGALTLFLLLVTVGNRLLKRWRRSWMLDRSEALLVYAMLLVVSGIPSVGLTMMVLTAAVGPFYYKDMPADVVATTTAPWLRVNDRDAVRQFYHGLDAGARVPWGVWVPPLLAWGLFALLLYTAFLCLALLLRRAWIEDERLTFPLVQVPLEIVGRDAYPTGNRAFFRNPIAWAGLAVPVVLHSLNALHAHWPAVPNGFVSPIPFGEVFVDRPWNALSDLRGRIYFSVIGLTFLLTSEVSLSLWFFFLVSRLEVLLFTAMGFDDRGGAGNVGFTPTWFVTNQMWGALLFFGALLLAEGLRSAWREQARLAQSGDREGSRTLRLAFSGFGASLLLLGGWLTAAGGQLPVQLGGLLFWMLAMLSLTRLVCAGGLLLIDTNYLPRDILYRVFGAHVVRPPDLAVLTYHNTVVAYFPQLNMLPFMFSAVKLADEAGEPRPGRAPSGRADSGEGAASGVSARGQRACERQGRRREGPGLRPRRWVPWTAAAILLAIPLSFYLALSLVYERGALALSEFHLGTIARYNFGELQTYLIAPSTPQVHTPLSLGVGAGVMAALIALRRSVAWWPLSPLGYLVGSSYTVMHQLWFCVLLGWAANALVRRYGGLQGFLRFRPFFLGLVLGEFLTAAAWMGIDALLEIRGHNVFPG